LRRPLDQRDYRNRLTSVTNENNAGQVTQTVTYTYDAFDRMVGRTLSIPGQADQKTAFVYDGEQILEQFDGTGSGNLTAENLSHRYLWGPAVDQLMADEQVATPSQAGNVVWALTDNLGTVRDLAVYNSATNTTAIVNHRTFDAFGNMLSQTNPATGNAAAVDCLFGFTGLAFDNATGMNVTPTRPYNPNDGRWVQPDREAFAAGDSNLYRYCGNNTTEYIDPTGEQSAGGHHPYPLYLGGAMFQDLIQLTKEQHKNIHAFFRNNGWGYNDASRAEWAKLTLAEQEAVIRASLKSVGLSDCAITRLLAKAMIGANPGIKTARTGKTGIAIGITTFLIAIGLAQDGAAREDVVVGTFHPIDIISGGASTMGDAEWHPAPPPPPPLRHGPEPLPPLPPPEGPEG
jgi:RHS repeat-associated protein